MEGLHSYQAFPPLYHGRKSRARETFPVTLVVCDFTVIEVD